MPQIIEPETPRLRLRQWRESDREPFAALNADPEVMEFFPSLQSREASDASIDAWQARFASQGWSNWAIELRATGEFLGFTGLSVPRRVLPFSPCVEVGWRLAREHWGRGYATEAARAALEVGFTRLGLGEIVSFTTIGNLRSRAVMERIGMRNAHQDFDHPGVPEGHPLRRHCLYRMSRGEWAGSRVKQSLGLVSLVVRDYDEALAFFVGKLGFALVADRYVPEQSKRWVVVSPPGASESRLLLARASSPEQESRIGAQTGGRVFLFLHTDDFWRDYERYRAQGVEFVRPPEQEPYGTVAVFKDLYGNLWDLLQPKE